MRVSIITPTYQRHDLLKLLYRCVQRQTYQDVEWLILDDSPTPSAFFVNLIALRVKYFYFKTRLTVGEKRNYLVEATSGEVIVHFDDDDYYAPIYVEQMVDGLGDADFFKLSGWFAYSTIDQFFGYWETSQLLEYQYKVAPCQSVVSVCTTHLSVAEKSEWLKSTLWGYGFSYIYTKSVWEMVRFNPAVVGWNDYCFAKDLIEQKCNMNYAPDLTGLVLHMIHTNNVSFVVPQYQLPNFLLTEYFGHHIREHLCCLNDSLLSQVAC